MFNRNHNNTTRLYKPLNLCQNISVAFRFSNSVFRIKVVRSAVPSNNFLRSRMQNPKIKTFQDVYSYILATATCFGPCWPSSGGIYNYCWKLLHLQQIIFALQFNNFLLVFVYSVCLPVCQNGKVWLQLDRLDEAWLKRYTLTYQVNMILSDKVLSRRKLKKFWHYNFEVITCREGARRYIQHAWGWQRLHKEFWPERMMGGNIWET
jgi:hypothetical protein